MFDRRMIDPPDEELANALLKEVMRAGKPVQPLTLDRPYWLQVVREARQQAEGQRLWDGLKPPLRIMWWTDYLGRRHVRITNPTVPFGSPTAPQPANPDTWPPLGQVYPEHVLFRQRPGREKELLAVCRCGAIAPPADLAWMGDCCAACHDRSQERARAPIRLPKCL